jgi:hypothetical protein
MKTVLRPGSVQDINNSLLHNITGTQKCRIGKEKLHVNLAL